MYSFFCYDNTKVIDNLLKNCFIIDKSYDSLVSYTFKISLDDLDYISDELLKYGNLSILEDCYINK